jgi:hypothetical protein
MFTKHNDNLSIHKQNDNLLFQFFLSELFTVFEEKQKILALSQEIEVALAQSNSFIEVEKELDQLACTIFTLVDATEGFVYASPWIPHKGCLGKLHHYAQHLIKKTTLQESSTTDLLIHINKAFHYILQSMEQLQELLYFDSKKIKLENIAVLTDKLTAFSHQMNLIPKICADLIFKFFHDENVLFFLIRHQEDLERLQLTQLLQKVVTHLYKGSNNALKTSLTSLYTKRGFSHLAKILDEKIDEYLVTTEPC